MSASARSTSETQFVKKIKFYFSPKNIFTKEDRQYRLNWRQSLCLIAFSVLACWFLDLEGKFDISRPVLAGLGVIYIIVQLRWHLRNYVWFWVTIIFFFMLYSVLIFAVKWNTDGPSRGIIGGLMGISVYLIFVILHAFEARLKRASITTTQPGHHAI